MREDPLDSLAMLEEFISWMTGWCDQNGDYDTGMHSVSTETLLRMRRLVGAAVNALEIGFDLKFPDGMDSMSYLTFDGDGKVEVV